MADIPTIYVLLLIAWAAFTIGFFVKQYAIVAMSSFMLIILSIFIIAKGLNGTSNWVTDGFAIVQVGVGAYALIRGAMELMKD